MWITVPIVCVTEEISPEELEQLNETLYNLRLPIYKLQDIETDIRVARLNTKHIVTYYPANEPEKTIVETLKGNYSVVLTVAQFDELILNGKKAKNTR